MKADTPCTDAIKISNSLFSFLGMKLRNKSGSEYKGQRHGMGGLLKQGFIRTQKALQRKSALLTQTLKSTWLEIETSKQFLINL